jgi:polar amino acid transport system substrate-binding protein
MRMTSIALRLSCILALCLNAHAKAADTTLIFTTENYPPFNMVDPNNDNISGISTEKVKEIMHRAGETYTITAYPWARSFQMARTDANTCVFSTTRSPEREAMFKWVGPLVKNNWYIFARADDRRKPKSLEDLRPYVMGTYRNDAVAEFLTSKGFKTDIANADIDNPRKLLLQRFDFWATGELLGLAILKSQGLQGKIVPRFHFNQTEMYLACHTGIATERIEHFNQILKDMERDGTAAAIEKKYK